jgi:hypothetical protein
LELAASHSLLRNRVNGADLQLYIRFVELQRYLTENTANVSQAWYHADRRASGTEAAGVGNTVTGGELIGYRTSRPPVHTLDRDCRSVSDYQTKSLGARCALSPVALRVPLHHPRPAADHEPAGEVVV